MNHHLRISDGYSHAEEFQAETISQFRPRLLAAMDRFVAWRVDQIPAYQTHKRAEAARDVRYQLHLRDPFAGGWLQVNNRSLIPYCDRRCLFRDGGQTMWAAVEFTHYHADQLARFFGRHPSGENVLGDFLREHLPTQKQTLTVIDGGKHHG